jgi:hypothetical protein
MNQDLQHLKLLSIFYYVVGGLLAVFAFFPIFHFLIGLMMIVSPSSMGGGGPPDPLVAGLFFVLLSGAIMLLGWAWAVALMVTGWFLSRCKRYLFCLVMAGIACLFHPFGTVLGIFTIIVLIRPSVKRLFENGGLPPVPEDEDETPIRYDDHITRGSYDIRIARGEH